MIFTDCPPSVSAAKNAPSVDPSAFYNALWNTSEHGVCALEVLEPGVGFRFISCNRAYAQRNLVSVESIQGLLLSEVFSPEVVARYQQHYDRCVQTQQAVTFEEKLCVGGQTTYWRLTVYPLIAASGVVNQLVVVSDDITQSSQIAPLVESRQILQQVIDTVPAVIFWKDCNSHYLGCNQAFAQIAGKDTVEEIVGKNDYDLVWKKEESDWFVSCDQRIMKADRSELDILEPQLQAGGRQAWLNTSKIPLHDSNGKVSGILGLIEDITEKKEAEDQKVRLLAILEATPDIVSITDAYGVHCYLNQSGQRMFNTSLEQVQRLNLTDLVHPDTANMLISQALPTAREKGIWSGESMIRNCFGKDIPVSHVIISHKSEEGLTERFSSIMRDISDRKAAETNLKKQSKELSQTLAQLKKTQAQIIQSEKMSGLGQMVAGIAHEINNPVNFIHGNLQPAIAYTQELLSLVDLYNKHYPNAQPEIESALETCEIDFVREDLPKLMASMCSGTERIREIVLSLRNFSRLDESDVKSVDIHEGLDSTLVILGHRLKTDCASQPIEVIKHYGPVPLVDCYPSQLNQVFMNVMANAIDALAECSTPQLTLTTELKGDFVSIRLHDNGVGIPADVQSQVLDPFFTTKPIGKGTGMGMAISYQIITEKHGGHLTFCSEVGKGTTFTIGIPVDRSKVD
ncbi:MAG: PAS domain-containing protein [Cyanobacteria bacterium J06560_2]